MKARVIAVSLLAAALSAVTASAHLSITVACPNGGGGDLSGIKVTATQVNGTEVESGVTDSIGNVLIGFNNTGDFNVCVDISTLPAGASLAAGNNNNCQVATVPPTPLVNNVNFDLTGTFCTPPAVAFCWETGGGQIDSDGDGDKDSPCEWSFGGVIYPGCSSTAAGGGNLNIVNHVTGAHFKGENFVVDNCRGVSDRSPKVKVNIIDWHGTGEVTTSAGTVNVTFVGTFRDSHDSGANADGLYIQVTGPSGIISDFAIGSPPSNGQDNLYLLSTGNVQIHQSGCGK